MTKKARIHVVPLEGIITPASKKVDTFDLNTLDGPLEEAFSTGRKKASMVVLAINSPGGSPGQAEAIARRVQGLRKKTGIPVLAAVTDAAASGGYWIACAADEIVAMNTSLVGSIGVIAQMHDVTDFIEAFGIKYHRWTSGEHKGGPSPFIHPTNDEVTELKRVMDSINQSFKSWVTNCRNGKLAPSNPDIFTGRAWTGVEALSLGLVDSIGEYRDILNTRFPDGYDVIDISVKQKNSLIGKILNHLGTSVGQGIISAFTASTSLHLR